MRACFKVLGVLAMVLAATETVVAGQRFKGICAVTAGTTGGIRYATLKCAKASSPKRFVIRSTIWENKDEKAYRQLAKAAGRRFNCTLTQTGTTRDRRTIMTHYKITNC